MSILAKNHRMTAFSAVTATLVLILLASLQPAFAQTVYLNVVKVDSPSTVEPGQTFTVKVTVDYRFNNPTTIEVGLWDNDNNRVASENPNSWTILDVTGTGQKEVYVSVKAPSQQTTWHLSARAVYYIGNNQWSHSSDTWDKKFDVKVASAPQDYLNISKVESPSTAGMGEIFVVKVTIDYRFASSTAITVGIWDDARNDFASSSPKSVANLDVSGTGSRVVSINVQAPAREMDVWHLSAYAQWSVNNQVTHSSGWEKFFDIKVTISKFKLSLSIDPSEAASYVKFSGEGQYEKGKSVSVKFDETVPGSEGTRYVFVTFLVDGVAVSGNPISVTMDRDHQVVGKYKTQYYLTVTSEYGMVIGEDWYDKGSRATATLDKKTVSAGIPYVYSFKGWSGDASGTDLTSDPITMNGPKTAEAVWAKQFGLACLIATATYGSELSPEVSFLRGFRDNDVSQTYAGGEFMKIFNQFYYSFSPAVASYIGTHETARTAMKVVLYPLMGILHSASLVYSSLSFSPELAVLTAGLLASTLIGIVYFTPGALAFAVALRRLRGPRLRTKHLTPIAIVALSSVGLIAVAEVFGFAEMMQLATAAFVLAYALLASGFAAIKVHDVILSRAQGVK